MTQWSSWSSWGACSKTCDDNGMQTRTRRCVNGNTCQGVNFETSTCNEDISCKRKLLDIISQFLNIIIMIMSRDQSLH